MEQWYAVHTKNNAEYWVCSTLRERGMQTYVPEIIPTSGQKHSKVRPFFPGYLFARIDFEAIGLSHVQWIPGLRRIVALDGQPTPIPDAIVGGIRHKLSQIDAGGNQPTPNLKSGEIVRITDGPFQNMLAIFDGPTSTAMRVQVLLEILGASRVQVDLTDLEKTSTEADVPVLKPPRRTRGRGRRQRN